MYKNCIPLDCNIKWYYNVMNSIPFGVLFASNILLLNKGIQRLLFIKAESYKWYYIHVFFF